MKFYIHVNCFTLPYRLSATDALGFHRRGLLLDGPFLLMAKDWRVDWVDDDYEELTSFELNDPDFLEHFAEAILELW